MSRFRLTPSMGLGSFAVAAAGQAIDAAGVIVAERSDVMVCSIVARQGALERLSERAHTIFDAELPTAPRFVRGAAFELVWAGPGQWLALGQGHEGRAFEQRLREGLGDAASVTDQSDGRTILRIEGSRVRDALAKGVHIDLDPSAFRPGHAAITAVAYINIHFWQVDERPTYDVAVFRSYAAAFWEWLRTSAAEYGFATRF